MPAAVRAVGATAAGTGNITVNYPTRQNNDILLLFTESSSGQPVTTITAGAGGGTWTKIDGISTTDSELSVWWSRWTTGQATSLTVTDTGNHQIGGVMSISGCITTGTPYEGTIQNSAIGLNPNTNGAFGGVITTYYDTLIVGAISSGRDNNFTTEFSGYTNIFISNITERFDNGTNSGDGGGFGVFTADWNGIGDCQETTVTIANATWWGSITFAMIATDSLPHFYGWGIPL